MLHLSNLRCKVTCGASQIAWTIMRHYGRVTPLIEIGGNVLREALIWLFGWTRDSVHKKP